MNCSANSVIAAAAGNNLLLPAQSPYLRAAMLAQAVQAQGIDVSINAILLRAVTSGFIQFSDNPTKLKMIQAQLLCNALGGVP